MRLRDRVFYKKKEQNCGNLQQNHPPNLSNELSDNIICFFTLLNFIYRFICS